MKLFDSIIRIFHPSYKLSGPDISFSYLIKNRSAFENYFYTKATEAVFEIRRRRQKDRPNLLTGNDNVIWGLLHRDVTPNIEINRMLSVCDVYDLKPLFLDNPTDIFSCKSKSKYFLAKMGVLSGFGKNGGMRVEFKKVINFQGAEGKELNKIQTKHGVNLIDYHKSLFFKNYKDYDDSNIYDIANFVGINEPYKIYKRLFELSIYDGIMLENFVPECGEIDFIKKVVYRAFKDVWNECGKKPLITPFEPLDTHHEDFWYYYNVKVLEEA